MEGRKLLVTYAAPELQHVIENGMHGTNSLQGRIVEHYVELGHAGLNKSARK